MSHALTLRAGPDALRLVRERGLRAQDIDILPGASGGAKWLALAGLDRYLFGTLLAEPRTRPLHLIGSSIGSWRMACLAQRDPVAALARGHHAYIYEQRYSPKPSTAEVTKIRTTCSPKTAQWSFVAPYPCRVSRHPRCRPHGGR